ncbi:hypothetical protein TSAR_000586 [Trichomalopsis sarcophagae]|uniref:C2H2-type domain-containing protein n=1 Tax=Trichomalopsis sarcophagae TaxID=543379 RepID=A0A232ED34_9HYME|nr:hypothetical protein TSAR_000586 [Trichomalopsis sarcophagae]
MLILMIPRAILQILPKNLLRMKNHVKHVECYTFEEVFENHSINQNTVKKSLKRRRFSTQNLIDMYCCDCKKVRKRVRGDKRTVCKKCKVSLKYQCIKCKTRYTTYKKAFLHIKTKCNQAPLFQCSACNYEARNEVKLNDHVQNRHTLQECSGCGKRYESNQMVKHQLHDCRSWNNPLNCNDTCSKTKQFNADKIEFNINQKPQVIKPGLFLERYCKTCDETLEKVRGVNNCKDCKSLLLYQCIICCNRYSSIMSAYQHIRSCIQLAEFHCSECGFQTVYKTSLVNHIESKHVLQECEVCDVICKNRRSLLKHKKYECKNNQRVKGSKSKRNKTSA